MAQLADDADAALADVAMVVVVVVLKTRIFGIFSISIQLETKRNLYLCGWCVYVFEVVYTSIYYVRDLCNQSNNKQELNQMIQPTPV